jgi:hypothetical protein
MLRTKKTGGLLLGRTIQSLAIIGEIITVTRKRRSMNTDREALAATSRLCYMPRRKVA